MQSMTLEQLRATASAGGVTGVTLKGIHHAALRYKQKSSRLKPIRDVSQRRIKKATIE